VRFEQVRRAIYDEPWAVLPSKFEAVLELIEFRLSGGKYSAEELAQWGAASRPGQAVSGGVAVIPVHGVLAQHSGLMQAMSGGTSTDALTQAFRQSVADPNIGAIVLDMDSPGGSVYGIQELGAEIQAARAGKPIVAVANSLMASAAYWLGSQCSEVVCTPGGELGSIGVLAAHTDTSALDAALGVKTTLVSAGKYKTEGSPYEPLAEDARGFIQSRVNEYYGMFVAAVAAGRGVNADQVRNGMGEGRVVGAKQAVSLGMADRVATLDATITRLQSGKARVGGHRAAAGILGISADDYVPDPYQRDPDGDETIKCPVCGKYNDTDAIYCDQCGTKLAGRSDIDDHDEDDTASADMDFRQRRHRLRAGSR